LKNFPFFNAPLAFDAQFLGFNVQLSSKFAPMSEEHKAAFISIIGKPNAGKSTLLNALMGQKLAITNAKAQTTRHRIRGMVNHENCQLVFSDTPGIINPSYKLQEKMMQSVQESIEDADIIILVVDATDSKLAPEVFELLEKSVAKKILVINKMDESGPESLQRIVDEFLGKYGFNDHIIVSALHKFNTKGLLSLMVELAPEHPAYFPIDQLTDKSDRFLAAEMIREKMLTHYQQEIPYSVEVVVESFKETKTIIRISAVIYVERDSQKIIIIGKRGLGLKRIGTEARKDMERLFDNKVFLELFVKVRDKWRNDDQQLKRFGYGTE
jgi:GTP-binding protein Era